VNRRNAFILGLVLLLGAASSAGAEYVRPSRIVMLWDFIQRTADNRNPGKRITHNGINVLSPTWFSIKNRNGTVSSLADKGYVRWAHDNGIKVWAIFENRSDRDLTFWILSNNARRKGIIDRITGYVREYGLDGINIDFEAMSPETGRYFEQFITELYQALKPLGIVLSVDIPLPARDMREICDIGIIARNSDYIILMGYDQHHSASETIGPVAAIGWVRQGIKEALQYFSRDRLILGIPFYTRIWIENRKGSAVTTSSELKGMKETYERFKKNSRIWDRDRATEQIYAEYSEGTKTYKVWLEDEHSISLKLDAVNDYDLAGISAWRSGWEWNETWDMIYAYFK